MDLLREPVAQITKLVRRFGKCKYFNGIKIGSDHAQRFVQQDNAGLQLCSIHRILSCGPTRRAVEYLDRTSRFLTVRMYSATTAQRSSARAPISAAKMRNTDKKGRRDWLSPGGRT